MSINDYNADRLATPSIAGDMAAVTASDSVALVNSDGNTAIAMGLWVQDGGTMKITLASGNAVTIVAPDSFILPAWVTHVWSTGLTASNIFGFFK